MLVTEGLLQRLHRLLCPEPVLPDVCKPAAVRKHILHGIAQTSIPQQAQ